MNEKMEIDGNKWEEMERAQSAEQRVRGGKNEPRHSAEHRARGEKGLAPTQQEHRAQDKRND